LGSDARRILGIDHVGVLVEDFGPVTRLAALLGMRVGEPETHPDLGVAVLWLELDGFRLEVLQPLGTGGRVAAALDDAGPGLHHLALRVDDTDAALQQFRADGIATADRAARPGLQDTMIGFLDSDATAGLRVELVSHA
jgi:methylmalonyl-CoA/ethylmalonyl-CoA epimerase